MNKLKIGDKVCYRATFCQSIGQLTGSLPAARGHIIALKSFGNNAIAYVKWENDEIPKRVLVSNLCKIGFNLDFSKN